MSARGEIVESRLRPTVCEAVETAAASLDHGGVRALRVLLHAGITAYWPLIKATPYKQIRAYESAVRTIRERWESSSECVADPITAMTFQQMDAEIAFFLELCAQRSNTQWLEPVDAIAAYCVSMLQGTVLRWLACCDDETTLVVLDDLVSGLTARAVDA